MRLHEIAEQPSLIKRQLAGCSVFTRCYILPKCSYLNDKSPGIPLSSSLPVCTSLLQCCVSQPWPKKIYIIIIMSLISLPRSDFTIWNHTETLCFVDLIIIVQDKTHLVCTYLKPDSCWLNHQQWQQKQNVLSIKFFGEFQHADDTVSSATALADTKPLIKILRCFSKSAMAAPRPEATQQIFPTPLVERSFLFSAGHKLDFRGGLEVWFSGNESVVKKSKNNHSFTVKFSSSTRSDC